MAERTMDSWAAWSPADTVRPVSLHAVPLACGHTRHVVDGIRRMIGAGHITTQTCLLCEREQYAVDAALTARLGLPVVIDARVPGAALVDRLMGWT